MTKTAVYMLAQYPKDFAMSAGLADIIREVKPGLPVHLICATEPNSASYQWDTLSDRFDSVQWVRRAMHGVYRDRFNMRGLIPAFTKGFSAARKVRKEMQKLRFEPDSIAFVLDGYSLNQNIFLRRVRDDPNITSVLISEQTDNALLSDFVLGYAESLYFNLFQRFFGTAYYDVFWLRTEGYRKTAQREYRFRNNPADYTFFGEHAFRRAELHEGQTYWPYYLSDTSHPAGQESVIVYGGIFEWVPLISLEPFYKRYNELLELIRTKHQGQRLIYLEHPGQPEERAREMEQLDLRGFEVKNGISSEAVVTQDRSITTAYAVVSTALFTTACLGVRSHFLYSLFDDDCVPPLLKQRLDHRWVSEIHPDMRLDSVKHWLSGEADYTLEPSSGRVRAATTKMLEAVGLLHGSERITTSNGVMVTPEDRWLQPLERLSVAGILRAVIGIPPTYSVRNGIGRAITAPVRLLRRLIPGARA
jgi:hypothetical protein